MNELESLITRIANQAAAEAARLAVQGVIKAQQRDNGERWKVADVARHTGLSPNTIRAYEGRGTLPQRVGGTWLKATVLERLGDGPRPTNAPRQAHKPRQS
jgi:hypothetical protein